MAVETLSDFLNQGGVHGPNYGKEMSYLYGLINEGKLAPDVEISKAVEVLTDLSFEPDLLKQEQEVIKGILERMGSKRS